MGIIDKNTYEALLVKNPKTPTFYSLPKTHKNLQRPPGRPIISGIGSDTEKASRLIDSYLYPHVSALPSYIQDTPDLLKRLQDLTIPPNTTLVAIDIEALYSSIPHKQGIKVIREFLSERPHTSATYNNFITKMLEHILNKNVFTFDGSHFLQVQGVAMGTCCAPSYANLYLGGWERAIFSDERLGMYWPDVLLWLRYIDDVLVFWTGTQDNLDRFFEALQENHFNLKFTMQSHPESISFLDIQISKSTNGIVNTTLYRKPTAGNTLLHANSFHPQPLLQSIPYSQYLRLRRICSNEQDYKKEALSLRDRLLLRGYTRSTLRKAYNKACRKETGRYHIYL